jgi:plastocyanin
MIVKFCLFAFLALIPLHSMAQEFTVDQQDKSFSEPKLTIKVGDKVHFKNSDPFFHNVFSLSDAKTFDLGSYPQGQHRTITFTRPGRIHVECAIHPQMKMTIEVKE